MQAPECSAFVGDGYDTQVFIRGVPRLYPDVRLTLRVLTQTERDRWIVEVDAARLEQKSELTTRWMATRIVSWDLPDQPSAESCGKVVPALYSAQRLSASTKSSQNEQLLRDLSNMCSTPFGINEEFTI